MLNRKSSSHEHLFANRMLSASNGGFGGAANTVTRASVRDRIEPTGLPFWVHHLHIDYPNARDGMPAELIRRYGRRAQELPEEEVIDLPIDPIKEMAMNDGKDDEFAALDPMCPRSVLISSRSDQAGQKPSIARCSTVYIADRIAESIGKSLNSLDITGDIVDELRRSGIPEDRISRRIRVPMIVGNQGGTGTGSSIPTAIIATSVARDLNIGIELELHAAFNYRATQDEEEGLRRAIGEQASLDIEELQKPGQRLWFKSPQGTEYSALTPLFHRVIVVEGHGTLRGNAAGMALSIGETLAFRATSPVAAKINTAHAQNILSRARN